MLKHIQVIINPASGADLPVLAVLNRALKKYKIAADIHVTQKAGEATHLAQASLSGTYDAVVVYGGDGTVMEVAQALCFQNMPMVVLPGGTANVLAKELKLPLDLVSACELLGKPDLQSLIIDMAECNRMPFIIRLNTGILAKMITDTSRTQKDTLGTLAYALSALKNGEELQPVTYELTLDGKVQTIAGVALMITNIGNIGLPGVSLLPEIRADDGKLDVVVLESADLASLVKLATSTVTPMTPPNTLQHWSVEQVKLSIPAGQSALLDDRALTETDLSISVLPKALTLLV